jgi:tRNA dimethylallyltransferase
MHDKDRLLVVILGPTASGKTELTIRLAETFGGVVISADSRQFYREMRIGTSRPTDQELKGVPHFFLGHLSITDYYSAGRFESEVLSFLRARFQNEKVVFMTGGSGLYIDAVCNGIDDTPSVDKAIRKKIQSMFETYGQDEILERLKSEDPVYFNQVDKKNPQRIIRALEVIEQTGKPYSLVRKKLTKKRPFAILKIGLDLSRQELFDRINSRVDSMMNSGLLEEVKKLITFRDQIAMRTVGYEELITYLDGKCDLNESVRLIKRNTRRYAKRQITWFKKDPDIHWFHPKEMEHIKQLIRINLPGN